jgi:APA family basic amino acid/polyamine antiporter
VSPSTPPLAPSATPDEAPSRLARRLGLVDSVVIGLGSMIGAGVFVAFGPAAAAAGNGLVVGLCVAALVAACNATSSARLAARYPESGGAYVYGRERLGEAWGWIAGWGFVVGKLASCAAMAMTFATYAWPAHARPLAALAVLALTFTNGVGVKKTAALTRVLVALVLVTLAVAVIAIVAGGKAEPARLWPLAGTSVRGVLQAAGFLFFAFAGYARLATLGEEVVDPARTIPRAIPIALGLTLVVYATVALAVLAGADVRTVATSKMPVASAVAAGGLARLGPVVRAGAAIASLGVLLSLVAGISRTIFAMASRGDLQRALAAVHPRHRVPHRAVWLVGALVATLVALVDLRQAIGFSSFAVLGYYAIANAAAWTLTRHPGARAVAALGVLGCVVVALTLPAASTLAGAAVLGAGAIVSVVRRHIRA